MNLVLPSLKSEKMEYLEAYIKSHQHNYSNLPPKNMI